MCAVISNTLLSRRGSPAASKKLFNEDKGESNRAKLNRLSATRLTTGRGGGGVNSTTLLEFRFRSFDSRMH